MVKTQAVVLQAFRYGESSHIVRLFTRSHGVLSCLVKGQGRRSPLSTVLMQPLSLIDALVDVRPNRQFQFLRECTPDVLLQSVPADPAKNGVAFFLCEFLYRALCQSPVDEQLFDFVRRSVIVFDETDKGSANFHLVFLIKLTHALGLFPNLSDYRAGAFFDMAGSLFVDRRLDANTLDAQQTEAFVQLMRMDYANMHLFALSRAQRNDILEHILTYYRLHLPELGTLKSLDVLRQLYA